jgi:hypothetical protein
MSPGVRGGPVGVRAYPESQPGPERKYNSARFTLPVSTRSVPALDVVHEPTKSNKEMIDKREKGPDIFQTGSSIRIDDEGDAGDPGR